MGLARALCSALAPDANEKHPESIVQTLDVRQRSHADSVQPPLFSRPCSAGIQSKLYDLGIDYKGAGGVAHVKMMVLECSPFGPSSALSDRLAVAARCPERPQ